VTCITCINTAPHSFFPPFITATCSHPSETCRHCVSSWISSCIKTRGHASLTCPQCHERLKYDDIKRLASPKTYDRYEALVLHSYLSKEPSFHWCIGPDCQSGQYHADSNPIFRCDECEFRSCVKHKVPWHTNLTCAEFDAKVNLHRRETEEETSRKKIKETSKQCP
ncbi:hypothetical protein BU23DRAFT_432384, partial [Bimuria novae-zelandiae CBS 107.79]